ncbi:MAG: hypothetical protein IPL49_19005 [Saprospirales bacterium]|nr:hypothetical protein [Saprospirales bacterium]
MKTIIMLSFLLLFISDCKKAQNHETTQNILKNTSQSIGDNEFNRLKYDFGNRLILEAALSTGIIKMDFLEAQKLKVDSIEAFMIPEYISMLEDLEVEQILQAMESDLAHDQSNKMDKINTLYEWCSISITLNSIFDENLDEGFPYFEELISDIPSTSRLLEAKLVNPAQTWSSLSSRQTIELNYEVINYLSSLSTEKRIQFYFQYFKRMNK